MYGFVVQGTTVMLQVIKEIQVQSNVLTKVKLCQQNRARKLIFIDI